jgi:hypothetical protein
MMGLIVETVWPSQLVRKKTSQFAGEQLENVKEEVGNEVSNTIFG